LHLSFKPGERGDDPFLALAYPLKEALGTTGLREQDLADELGGDSEKLAQRINELLNERPSGSELLLVIDQFEELFTLVKADLRQTFLDQLTAILTIPRVRLMATLRADFYPKAMSAPALTELLRGQGTFPLSAPGVGALHEMVTRPAQIAGLELENGLVDRILDDTGAEPGALSLMAFALHRLYERDKGTGRLSLKDYTAIGGVAGAIRQRAEDTLNRLGSGAGMEKALDNVFERLIEVDEHEVATRRRAARREIGTDPLAVKLVDALIDARLLVTGKGEGNEPTVEVAHEALLSSWPRLEKWVEVHAAELRAKRDLERAAREWDEAGRPKWSGLASGDILKRYRSAPSGAGPAKSYLAACRRLQVWRSLMTGGTVTLVLLVAAFGWWLNQAGLTPKVASTVLLTRAGVFDPPPQPKMVPVPDGRFEMGSDPEVDSDTRGDEQPRHQVAVEAFYIGQYEVTFKEYDAFVRSTGRRKPNDYDWGRGSQPVIDVSWEDAVAYAKWLSLMTGKDYRLPSKPAFRQPFKRRRCLVPANGFYEWRKTPSGKTPYYIRLKDDSVMGFAGLWDVWSSPGGERIASCTIVTTAANALIKPLHDRMPLIISPQAYEPWLAGTVNEASDVVSLSSALELEAYPVSTRVNKPENDDPGCIERVA
jgi:putative SOS response-associated peptidase YedK